MFQKELLENTRCMKHWAGRQRRGVTQFYGSIVKDLLEQDSVHIDVDYAITKLEEMIKING